MRIVQREPKCKRIYELLKLADDDEKKADLAEMLFAEFANMEKQIKNLSDSLRHCRFLGGGSAGMGVGEMKLRNIDGVGDLALEAKIRERALMRIATLFSGIGAPEQAAARVWDNHEIAFACEWDKFARQSYKAIYEIDEAHFHTDVRQMDGTQYKGKCDILIGGSPCQAFSIAGLRGGTDDERGQLIYQYVRVVEEVKAPVIVYENVKGMMSIDGGRTIKEFVEALREIGYYCHYEVLNTKDYGVPQNRERLFLVGFLDYEVYHRFQFAPKQKLTKRLKDVLEPCVDEKYYLSETAIKGFQTHAERMAERGNGFKFDPTDGNNIASSVTTRAGGRLDDNFVKEPKILQKTQGETREYKSFCPTIMAKMSGTLPRVENNYRIRKLTPLECWRLQDFPDEAHEKAKAAGVSDSQRYKQAGNSMTVAVLEMIFRQIEAAMSGESSSNSLFDFAS